MNAVKVRLKHCPSAAVSVDDVARALGEIGFFPERITFDGANGSFTVTMPSHGVANYLLSTGAFFVKGMEAAVTPFTTSAATSPVRADEIPRADPHLADTASVVPKPRKRRPQIPAQQAVPSAPADPVRAGMQPTPAFSSDHYQYQHPAGNRPAQQTQHTGQIPGQPAATEPGHGNVYQPASPATDLPAQAVATPRKTPRALQSGQGEPRRPVSRLSTSFDHSDSHIQHGPEFQPPPAELSHPNYPASSPSQPPLYPHHAEDLRSSKEQDSETGRAFLRSPGSHAHRHDDFNRPGDGVELLVSGAPMEKSRNVTMYLKTKHLSGGGGDVELENGLGTPGQMVFRMADAEAAEQVLGKSSHAIGGINNPVTIERFLKMTAPPNAVLVTGIDCSTCADQELVGMVIGAIAKSEPVTVEFDSGVGQAIVTFSEPNTAERACQGDSGDLEMLGASVKVALYQKPVTAPRRPHAPTSFGDAHSQGHPASHPSAMEQSQAGYVSAPLRYGSQLDQDVDFNRAGDGVELLVSGVPMEKSRNVTMYLKTKHLSGGGGDVKLANGLGIPGQMVFRMADAEAAEQVLGKSSHTIGGINNPVTIERFLKMTAPPNAVLVTGIDSSTCADQALIGMVIGAIAKSEPVTVEFDSGVGQAIVTFSEPNDAERACQGHSGDLEMLGTSVKAALYQKPVTTPRRPHAPTSFGDAHSQGHPASHQPAMEQSQAGYVSAPLRYGSQLDQEADFNRAGDGVELLVSGVPMEKCRNVTMYLKTKHLSGGGGDVELANDLGMPGQLVVRMADAEAAARVLAKSCHAIGGIKNPGVTIEHFSRSIPSSDTVLVTGLGSSRSDTGEIGMVLGAIAECEPISVEYDSGTGQAIVTFSEHKSAERACQGHSGELDILGTDVKVALYKKPMTTPRRRQVPVHWSTFADSSPGNSFMDSTSSTPTGKPSHASTNPTAAGHQPNAQARHGIDSEYWKDHLLVTNLPSDFDPEIDYMMENLQRFLSSMTGVAEVEIVALQFRFDRALFHVNQPFDFDTAVSKCSSTPYSRKNNLFVGIRRVKQPCIIFCQLHESVGPIEQYFHKSFGEGSVAEVDQLTSTMAKVHFHRASDATAAASDPGLQSQGQCVTQLIEGLHFPAREDITANGKSTMKGALPNPVTIDISIGLSTFLQDSDTFSSKLSHNLSRIGGKSSISANCLTVAAEENIKFLPNWESVAEAMVREALKNYTEEIIDVPDELVAQYADFCEEDQNPDDIHIEFVADDSSLHVIGSSTLVRQCQKRLTKEINKKKKELCRLSDDSINCKTEVVDFLKKYSVIHDICTRAGIPPCTEQANGKYSVIIQLAGPKLKVEAAAKELRQKEQQVQLSPALNFRDDDLMVMMSTAEGRQLIEEHFQASGVQWHLKKSAGNKGRMCIVHFKNDEDDILENIDTLMDKVKAEEIFLTQTQQSIVQTTEFDDCHIQAAMTDPALISVRIHPNKQRLLISGEVQRVDELVHIVRSYLDKKGNVRKVVHLKGQHHLEFLQSGSRASTLAMLQSKYTHRSVQVNVTASRVTIGGPEKDVREAEGEFKVLAANFHSERMELSLPGIKGHLSEVAKEIELESQKQDVLVNFLSPEEAALDSAGEEDDDDVYEFLGNAGQVIDAFRFSAALSNGKRIVLLEGDITATTCSAITNAANENLQHAGGVAHAISTAGGLSIQRDCNNYVKQYGKVKTGTVYASDVVGALSCKRLVHAVGPRWEGDKSSARSLLHQCVENTLNAASDLDSLALPAISSGIYKFPPDTCAEEIITTVHGWLESNPASALQTVVIVDIKDTLLRAMQRHLLKLVPSAANTSQGRHSAPAASRGQTGAVSAARHGGLLAAVSSAANSAMSYLRGDRTAAHSVGNAATVGHGGCSMLPGGDGIRSAEGLTISILKGDITKCRADGIVNSCRDDLDLSKSGQTAAAIARVAGQGLQQDCHKYIKQHGKLSNGDFAVTPGHKLPASHVFHGVMPVYGNDNGLAEQILNGLVDNILADAHSRRLKSIVFPSLGAGNNRYPDHVVANTLLSAAIQFSRNHPQTSLKEVKFCIFDGKVKSAFDSMATRLCTSSSSMSNISSGNSAGFLGTTTSTPRSQSSFSYTAPSTSAKTPRIQVGLKQGNIAAETADVIVNSLMTSLDMAEGKMSSSIAKAAGSKVQADLNIIKQKRSPGVGEVISTSAGSLTGCQKIVHAVLTKKCGKQVLQDSILQCLLEADRLGCSSIAMPALGAGGLGHSIAESVEAVIRGIDSFERTKGGTTSLTVINLVIFDSSHMDPFRTALQSRSGSSQPTLPSSPVVGISGMKCSMPTVSVVKGNIVQEQTDAIVTTALPSLDMNAAAMSKSVLGEAGDIVQTELSKKKGAVKLGQATSTSAGRLKSKFIIHAVLCPRSSTTGQPFIEDVVTAVLVEAEKCKCSSLSIPALGAGGLGFSDKEVSDGTFSAIGKYFGSGSRGSSISTIKLVMWEAKHVPVFENAKTSWLAGRTVPTKSAAGPTTTTTAAASATSATAAASATTPTAAASATAASAAPTAANSPISANAQTAEELANTLLTHSSSTTVSLDSGSVSSQVPDLKTKQKELRQQRVQPLMGQSHPIQTVYFRLIGSSPQATQVMRDRINALVNGSLLSQSVSDPAIALLSDADDQMIISEAQGQNVLVTVKSVTEFELTGCKGDVSFVNGTIIRIASAANRKLTEQELAATKQGMEEGMRSLVEQLKLDTLPSIWTTGGKKASQLVSLVPSCREYKDAVRDFNKTCRAKVTDVARVENPSLYNVFVARCKALADDPCTTATTRILRLFHGSDDDKLEIIYNQGWDKNYAGKNAVYFGKGNYFARDAQFSYQYCGQVKNAKQRRMILALLVLKDTEVGYDGQIAPSQRSADPTQGRISATVDDLSDPSRLVAYEASQSYPAYVLTFNEL